MSWVAIVGDRVDPRMALFFGGEVGYVSRDVKRDGASHQIPELLIDLRVDSTLRLAPALLVRRLLRNASKLA